MPSPLELITEARRAQAAETPASPYQRIQSGVESQFEKDFRNKLAQEQMEREQAVKSGLASWIPEVPGFVGDVAVDLPYNIYQRAKGLRGENIKPLGFGEKVRAETGKMLGLYPEALDQVSMAPPPAHEEVTDALQLANPLAWSALGEPLAIARAGSKAMGAAKPMMKAGAREVGRAIDTAMLEGQGPFGQLLAPIAPLRLDVYHGGSKFASTPENPLGAFDPSKIGTGEGLQFGYGTYLTEAPDVGRGYVTRDMDYEAKLYKLYQQAEKRNDPFSMEILERAMMHKTPSELRTMYPPQAAGLISQIEKIPHAGALYKANLPDELIPRMLDLDKPFMEQPHVIKALEAEGVSKDALNQIAQNIGTSGDALYQYMARRLGGQKQASDYMRRIGIPGNVYFDPSQRDVGLNVRNFVVFPGEEKAVRIKQKMKDGGEVGMDAMRVAVWGKPDHKQFGGISKAAKRMAGIKKAVDDVSKFPTIDVYHGSPHRFAPTAKNPLGEFDPTKIGTGEGAQVYGMGHYLAEARGTGKEYAKNLANRDVANQGRLNAHANAQRLANVAGDPKYAADDIKFVLESNPDHPQQQLLQETLNFLESGNYKTPLSNQGYLYKVDLPDEVVPRMLDYDKPINEQSPYVIEALKRAGINETSSALAGPMAQGQEAHLAKFGIPGIKYLDAGSRGAGTGTRNFVVFPGNEELLTIKERMKKGGSVSEDAMRVALWNKPDHKQVGGLPKAGRMASTGAKAIEDALELKHSAGVMAKAGVPVEYKTPAIFERTAPRTKAEIEAMAQKMAPQFLGEFVKKAGKTESVAGKTKKQFTREQDLPIDIRGERPVITPVDIAEHKGSVRVGVPGDPSIAQRTLHGIGDVAFDNPVDLWGGPLYGANKEHFWASGSGISRGLRAQAGRASGALGGAPALGTFIRMPEGLPYAMHTLESLLAYQRPDLIDKKTMSALNEEIKRGTLKHEFPHFVGFEDPELLLLQAQHEPNLRKHIANTLMKPTRSQAYGLRGGADVEYAITEPELRNLEAGATGFSLGKIDLDKPLTPSSHPTYEANIPGQFLGGFKYPMPYNLTFPDTTAFAREAMAKKAGVNELGMFKMSTPRQQIDQQLIDEIKTYEDYMKRFTGKKKGGKVAKKADGGMTSDDLIVEERKL